MATEFLKNSKTNIFSDDIRIIKSKPFGILAASYVIVSVKGMLLKGPHCLMPLMLGHQTVSTLEFLEQTPSAIASSDRI